MKFENVKDWYRHPYVQKCDSCNELLKCFTQPDDCPEYYTDIYIECKCGNLVHFNLPVN